MIDPQTFAPIVQSLPMLQNAPESFKQTLQQTASFARLPKNRDVLVEGATVESSVLLISGVVRVYKIGETGREITLYRFGTGEACILTANAILSRQTFPALATVADDAAALIIPAEAFREWMGQYEYWRDFVFSLLAQRLSTLMVLVDEVAFRRMDTRVASWLLDHAQHESNIRITHQEIAAELGSSREVISRILEDFAAHGLIQMQRGAIHVLVMAKLQQRTLV